MPLRKILLANGPNLDMLGKREPHIYGSETLESLESAVRSYARQHDIALTCLQSNSEETLMNAIHAAPESYDAIVLNPGAYTHYSYALRDAIASVDTPVVEVHLSDVTSREEFRKVSVTAPVCVARVKGLGISGYCRAIDILVENDHLPRLGEGFEKRYAIEDDIIVAGKDEAEEKGDEPDAILEPFQAELLSFDIAQASRQRQDRVRSAFGQLGVSSFVVRDTPNIQWLTGFDGVFDAERAHALVIEPQRASLHTDSRYSNALRTAASKLGSNVTVDDGRVSHYRFVADALAREADPARSADDANGANLPIAVEDSITYAEYLRACEALGAERVKPTTDIVLAQRAVKDASELCRLRAAQAITDAAFRHIVDFMRPGMTEREVQLELESFMLRHGADGLAFGSIVASGPNGADPHAVPGSKRLEAGECVVMDFGASAFGYCSDMTRMVFLGEPHGNMARAWEVLRQANETVERMLKPGVTGCEAHDLAEKVLEEGGFGGCMGHGLGHGVGLECHELPVLNTRNDKPLVAGNVVTVEPGIYLPGEFGMRLEDCGVITDAGYEVFSALGHEMVVI